MQDVKQKLNVMFVGVGILVEYKCRCTVEYLLAILQSISHSIYFALHSKAYCKKTLVQTILSVNTIQVLVHLSNVATLSLTSILM